jgi:hypothetical protein
MPVLNRHSIASSRAQSYLYIRSWGDRDYWYISAKIKEPLTIPLDVIDKDATIVVNVEFEAFEQIVGKIYSELVIGYNINPKKILIISENADLEPVIKAEAKLWGKDLINYEWSLIFEHTVKSQTRLEILSSKLITSDTRPFINVSNKTFLNFNRRWRLHRVTLVALLYSIGILNKGHVSLSEVEGFNWNNQLNKVIDVIKTDNELSTLIDSHKEEIVALPNLYLDTKKLINRPFLRYRDIDPESTDNLYKDTYFSIVSETYFFEKIGRFISEKTFKPIAYHHPFILVTSPRSLELLRNLGYKTFHPYIDESYDQEEDNVKRMKMILREIERLSNMSTDEVSIFLTNVEPITKHNFDTLINKSKFIHKKI